MQIYKKLSKTSEANSNELRIKLLDEKALNDKRRNVATQLEHGNDLLLVENNIIDEKLFNLSETISYIGDKRLTEDQLCNQLYLISNSLKSEAQDAEWIN